jgi:hypothetical protein
MKIVISFLLLSLLGCASSNKPTNKTQTNSELDFTPQFTPGPPALVYKTSADYNNLVPILLSDDKTEIVSYPHPKDIRVGSGYPLPTLLNNGYLLDNRGINKNVAFLKLTYEEYSKITEPPTLKEMYELIVDKNPLTEMCDCGNKKAFTDIQGQLNQIIDNKTLTTKCKTLK